jgi:hypothetical protein
LKEDYKTNAQERRKEKKEKKRKNQLFLFFLLPSSMSRSSSSVRTSISSAAASSSVPTLVTAHDNCVQDDGADLHDEDQQQQQGERDRKLPMLTPPTWFDYVDRNGDGKRELVLTEYGLLRLGRIAQKDRFAAYLQQLEASEFKSHLVTFRFVLLWDIRTNDVYGTTRGVSQSLWPATLARLCVLTGLGDLGDDEVLSNYFTHSAVRTWYNTQINTHKSNLIRGALPRFVALLKSKDAEFVACNAIIDAIVAKGQQLLEEREGCKRIVRDLVPGLELALHAVAFKLFEKQSPTFSFDNFYEDFRPKVILSQATYASWASDHADGTKGAHATSLRPVLLMQDGKGNIHRVCGEREGFAFKLIETIIVHRICKLEVPIEMTPMYVAFVQESGRKSADFVYDYRGRHAAEAVDNTQAAATAFDFDFDAPVELAPEPESQSGRNPNAINLTARKRMRSRR